MQKEPVRFGGPGDLEAVEIRNLHWLISPPKFSQIVIGEDAIYGWTPIYIIKKGSISTATVTFRMLILALFSCINRCTNR